MNVIKKLYYVFILSYLSNLNLFKHRYNTYLGKYTVNVYYLKSVLRALTFLFAISMITILIKINIIKIEYIYMLLIILMFSAYLSISGYINFLDKKIKIKSYLTSNIFSQFEKEYNLKIFHLYCLINYIIVFIGVVIYLSLIEKFLLNMKNMFILFLFNINIFFFIGLILLIKIIFINRNKVNKYIKFGIYSFMYIFCKINEINFIKIKNLDLIHKWYEVDNKMKYLKVFAYSNIFNIVLLLVLIISYVLILKMYFKNNQQSNNFQRNSNEYKLISFKIKSFSRDFILKEVVDKVYFMPLILSLLMISSISDIKKNLIMVLILSFLFSQYNQRYMLKKTLFGYFKLINGCKNLVLIILNRLLPLQIIVTVICSLLVNNFNSGINLVEIIVINILYLILILTINTLIMIGGSVRKTSTYDIISNIRLISGLFLGIQTIFLIKGGF